MVKNRQEIRRGSAETEQEVRIGIVGADTKAGWAKVSHVPAVNGLPGLSSRPLRREPSRGPGKRLKPSVLIVGFPIPSR